MRSPERPVGTNHTEQEPGAYYRAAYYPREEPAWQAYTQIQNLILADRQADLSVYRIQLDLLSHVVVLGTPPPQRLGQRLERVLATGEPAELSTKVLSFLQQRRQKANKMGSWVERHYRPGKPHP